MPLRRPWGPFTLRAHLLAVVLAAVLPGLAIAVVSAACAIRLVEHVHQDQIDDMGLDLAASVDREFEADAALLQALAGPTAAGDALATGPQASLFAARAALVSATLGSPVTLRRRAAGPGAPAPAPLSAIARATATGRPAVDDLPTPTMSTPMTSSPMMLTPVMAVPVIRDGAVAATLDVAISVDRLVAALRRQVRVESGLAVLVDGHGRVVAASRDVARMAGQAFLRQPADPLLKCALELCQRGINLAHAGEN